MKTAMSDQRQFDFKITLATPLAERASKALKLLAERQSGMSSEEFEIVMSLRDAPFDRICPRAPSDSDLDLIRFTETLHRALYDFADSTEGMGLHTLDWNLWQNQGDYDHGETHLYVRSDTDGWVHLEPAMAIIHACQAELGAGPISFAYYQTLRGEHDAGTVTMVPGEEPEHFCLSQYMRDRLAPPPPAPGTGIAPGPEHLGP